MREDRSRDAALRRIARAHQRRRELDQEEVVAVVTARRLKVTWWDIGNAIGMQQPGATRKFKPLLDQHDPDPAVATGDEVVARLRRLTRARQDAEQTLVEAVAHARKVGVSWERIGRGLGMEGSGNVNGNALKWFQRHTVGLAGGSERRRRRTTSAYGRRG